jgi:uncharacterized protein
MTLSQLGFLFLAGIGAGITGSTAGLASLASYPALLAVGVPPVAANVTNTLGLIGSSIGSVAGSRRELAGQAPLLRRWIPWAFAGGVTGAVLLLVGPPGAFEAIVPFLVAGAAVLMLCSPILRRRAAARGPHDPSARQPWLIAAMFATFVYGGYFGAAAGVMLLALLLSATDRTLPVANALKNLLLGIGNLVAAVVFLLRAPVVWSAVPPLLIGCIIGGRLGPWVVRRVPPEILRWVIGLAGLALAVKLELDQLS